MAINSSLQQVSGGVASIIAGLIVVIDSSGKVQHFDIIGYILTFTVIVSIYLMYEISKNVQTK
jgi:hypothetical protein